MQQEFNTQKIMSNEVLTDENNSADYEGFCMHIKEYNKLGIPIGRQDLIRLAIQYNCEILTIKNGEVVFKKIQK